MADLKIGRQIDVVGDGRFAVTHHVDLAPLQRENDFIRNHNGKGIPRVNGHIQGGIGKRAIANIDPVTFMMLEAKGILSDPVAFKKWLNDPDNADFKIVEGKV